MKKLFLLLALVGMVATACEDDGVNEPTTPEDKTQPIKFIDNRVKALCINSWDTNGDAELSYEEAAAVTDIGTTFEGYNIISFTELAYFTGLSYIANEAFLDCGSLKKIELPHNITSIGDSAFAHCTSLTSVTIPDSVTTIGEAAFAVCSSLTSFYGKFASEDNRCLIVDGKLIAFAPAGLIEYTIPDSVNSIGDCTFYMCDSLESVTIPDSVTSIGEWAFRDCRSLRSVTIPDSVTSIGQEAFGYCTSLTSVTIPDSVTLIGEAAFAVCSSLTSFYGKFASEDNRCLIVDGKLIAFAPVGLTEYTIPDSATSIGDSAFNFCYSLTSVTIPDSVTEIGHYAFESCNSLTSVTIGNGVTTIGYGAFFGCDSLTSVTIGNSVTSIGEWTFVGCRSLESFYGKFASEDNRCLIVDGKLIAFAPAGLTEYTIPDSVTSIGAQAFSYCYSLTSVTIPDSVTKIGDGAFHSCESLTSVYCKPTTPQAWERMLSNGMMVVGIWSILGARFMSLQLLLRRISRQHIGAIMRQISLATSFSLTT